MQRQPTQSARPQGNSLPTKDMEPSETRWCTAVDPPAKLTWLRLQPGAIKRDYIPAAVRHGSAHHPSQTKRPRGRRRQLRSCVTSAATRQGYNPYSAGDTQLTSTTTVKAIHDPSAAASTSITIPGAGQIPLQLNEGKTLTKPMAEGLCGVLVIVALFGSDIVEARLFGRTVDRTIQLPPPLHDSVVLLLQSDELLFGVVVTVAYRSKWTGAFRKVDAGFLQNVHGEIVRKLVGHAMCVFAFVTRE